MTLGLSIAKRVGTTQPLIEVPYCWDGRGYFVYTICKYGSDFRIMFCFRVHFGYQVVTHFITCEADLK